MDILGRHFLAVEVEVKMRRHSAHRAWVSRKRRHFIEMDAEFSLWNAELDGALERAGTAISDFIFNAGEAWQKAFVEAARALYRSAAKDALTNSLRERG